MQEIEIKYRRFWINRRKKLMIPTNWMEINAQQLIVVAEHYLEECDDIDLLAGLYGVKRKLIKQMPEFFQYKLAEQFEFIKDFKPYNSFIIKNYCNLHAPRPRLEGMSFGQFMFVDTYFNDWAIKQDPDDLDRFIACLYLPRGCEFDSLVVAENNRDIDRMEDEVKYAITLNYRLIKEWLTEKYPLIFSKPDEEEEADEAVVKKKKHVNGSNWVKIFDNIVGDDIINQDKYAKLPVNAVLKFITKKIKENAKK